MYCIYIICYISFDSTCSVDNSDYMRNGDFVPTRMQAQQDAVNLVCMSKTRSNPENNVGLLKMSSYVDPQSHHSGQSLKFKFTIS